MRTSSHPRSCMPGALRVPSDSGSLSSRPASHSSASRGLPTGATVLDVGAATPSWRPPLVDAGYQVTVVGSDASCGRRLAALTSAGRCRFERADLLALPMSTGPSTRWSATGCLAHSIDWRRLVGELCRVARHRVVVDYPARRSITSPPRPLQDQELDRAGHHRPFALYGRGEVARPSRRLGLRGDGGAAPVLPADGALPAGRLRRPGARRRRAGRIPGAHQPLRLTGDCPSRPPRGRR